MHCQLAQAVVAAMFNLKASELALAMTTQPKGIQVWFICSLRQLTILLVYSMEFCTNRLALFILDSFTFTLVHRPSTPECNA